MIIINLMKKTSNDELYDFLKRPEKHKPGIHWNKVAWVVLFLIVAFCVAKIVSAEVSDKHITAQERITQYQILNGIPQRQWTINYK